MPVTFDPANRRIVVNTGVTYVTATQVYSRWKEWAISNAQFLPAFRVVGGDPIGGGRVIAPYFFLLNGWRLRPFEGDHSLVVDGNLLVDEGGDPVVQTLGPYRVIVQYTIPVQAQAIAVGSGLTPEQSAQLASAARNAGLIPALI